MRNPDKKVRNKSWSGPKIGADQDSLLFSRIAGITNQGSIVLYFNLLKILLDELDLHAENPKLALTIPKARKDLVVNLNARWVLNLNRDGSIAFMIGKSDFSQLQKIVKARKFFRYSKYVTPDDYFATYSYDKLTDEKSLQSITACWLDSCRAYEQVMRRSPYRKFHNHEFYEVASGARNLRDYILKIEGSSGET